MHISQYASTEHSPTEFWPRVLSVLHAELGEHRNRMWITPISLKSTDQDRVVLSCPTPFHHANVQEKFGLRIAALIAQFSGLQRPVEFVLERPQHRARDPQALFDATPATPPARRPTVDAIKRHVASIYNLQVSDLESHSRKRNVVRPRQLAMYIARKLTDQSYPQIARRFGPRDHTTILHGVNLIAGMVANNPEFAAEVSALMRTIRDSNPS